MKKYKLVKIYPGLHTSMNIGDEVEYYNNALYKGKNIINNLPFVIPKNQVEKFPEYWEEIIDKNPLKLEVGKTYKLQYIHCKSPIRTCKITKITRDGYPWMETSLHNGIVSPGSYRLIEEVVEYPIGTKAEDNRINKTFTKEVDGWYTSSKTGHTDKSISNANHIEVLGKVVEKDYEIMSLKCLEDNEIFYNRNGTYKFLFNQLEYNLKNGYIIHSVKRLSDSEVFTIKDHARPKKCNPNAFIITGFTLDSNNKYILALGGNGGININKLKPVKKPLFKTSDGIDIFEGDKFWYVNNIHNGYYLLNETIAKKNNKESSKVEGILDFSTKEAAEEYILMNKPCLSIEEVMNISYNPAESYTSSSRKLKELVKSKL